MQSELQPLITKFLIDTPSSKKRKVEGMAQNQSARSTKQEETKEEIIEFWNKHEVFVQMKMIQEFFKEPQIKETCYPPKEQIFSSFQKCTFENCKVVIVGQDPYIDENQAMGMCFSVPKYQKFPPSLRNIFKCIIDDTDVPEFTQLPKHGDLTKWAMQGVLLLNANLTVTKKKANSHSTLGWEKLTDKIIKVLNQQKKNLVFMLWGNFAQKKISFINENKHLILKACHPSPLAANKGDFVTSKHFSKCNKYLQENEIGTIEWKLE